MLKIEEIEKEIVKLEQCNMSYSVCQKLADMYIIADHWKRRETDNLVKEVMSRGVAPANDEMKPAEMGLM